MTRAISPAMAAARRMREAKGISQSELSRRSGFALMSVHRWDSGRSHPSVYAFETYLEALDLRLEIVPIEAHSEERVA